MTRNYLVLQPQMRLALGMYIRPTELESVSHMIKPTLTISPTGLFFLNVTFSPHFQLHKTMTSVSLSFKTNYRFGSLQFYIFQKTFNQQAEGNLSKTEQIRQSISLPVYQTKRVDVFYSDGTIMPSATLFVSKRNLRVSIPTSTVEPAAVSQSLLPSIYTVAALVVAFAYFWLVISESYQRFQKSLIFILGLIALFVFGIRRFLAV